MTNLKDLSLSEFITEVLDVELYDYQLEWLETRPKRLIIRTRGRRWKIENLLSTLCT